MRKKLFNLIFLLLLIVTITGCTEKTASGTTVNSESDMTENKGVLYCTREATGMNNSAVECSYDVYYNKGLVTKVHSVEKVTSSSEEVLETYRSAYENVFKVYKDLDYYTNSITDEGNTIISETTIEYDKVDLDKLKKLENTKDSIIKNGKVTLKDWLKFAENFGTKCTEK